MWAHMLQCVWGRSENNSVDFSLSALMWAPRIELSSLGKCFYNNSSKPFGSLH